MINHLTERFITAFWLGTLGYLLISFLNFSYEFTFPLFLGAMIAAFILFFYGFFFGYKTLLLPADTENYLIITRVTAAVWCGAIAFIVTQSMVVSLTVSPQLTLLQLMIPFVLALIFIFVGVMYGYRLLVLPKKVTYIKPFPTLMQRSISMIWFGMFGGILTLLSLPNFRGQNLFFIFLLASYLGFFYGYRILLLEASLRSAIKSITIGFIGSSYALIIVVFLFFLSVIRASTSPMVESVLGGIVGGFIIFLAMSVLVCVVGMISSLILYSISILVRVMKK